jgi:hypothetical protein
MPEVTVAVHHHDAGVPPARPGRTRRSRPRPALRRSRRGASRTAQARHRWSCCRSRRPEVAAGTSSTGGCSEVSILGDHHSIAAIRNLGDPGIGRAVAVRQLQRMHRIVSRTAQETARAGPAAERRQETSRRAKWNHPATARGKRAELQRGKEIITLEVRLVGEYFLDRHPR